VWPTKFGHHRAHSFRERSKAKGECTSTDNTDAGHCCNAPEEQRLVVIGAWKQAKTCMTTKIAFDSYNRLSQNNSITTTLTESNLQQTTSNNEHREHIQPEQSMTGTIDTGEFNGLPVLYRSGRPAKEDDPLKGTLSEWLSCNDNRRQQKTWRQAREICKDAQLELWPETCSALWLFWTAAREQWSWR
jgi:hypothetical protein